MSGKRFNVVLLRSGAASTCAPARSTFFGGVADALPFVGIFLTMGPAVLASPALGPVVTLLVLMLCYEERRTEGIPADQAAAVAVDISQARKKLEGEAPARDAE